MSGIVDENIMTIPVMINPRSENEATNTMIPPMNIAIILKIVLKISSKVEPIFSAPDFAVLAIFWWSIPLIFEEISSIENVDKKIAELLQELYANGKLTDKNVANELQKIRNEDGNEN